MPYRQVKDVIELSRVFHQQLRDYYEGVEEAARDERVKALLDDLSKHEARQREALEDYDEKGPDTAMETWLQFVPDDSVRQTLADMEIRPEMSADEVIARVMEIDAALLELYQQLSSSSSAPRVRELFTALVQMEEERMVRDASIANEIQEETPVNA